MLKHLSGALALAAALAFPLLAQAQQSAILSSGLPVKGHVLVFQSGGTNGINPVATDAGAVGMPSTSAPITDLPIVAVGEPLCIYDAPIASSVGYHKICFGANSSGNAVIDLSANGGATPNGLILTINGTNYGLPSTGAGSGNVVGPNTSVVGHLAIFNNTLGTLLADGGVLGTMATQNANAVAITGGTIAGVTMSGSTLTTATLTNPTINSATLSGALAGTFTFNATTNLCTAKSVFKSANYTAVQADSGSLLELGGGATFSLTFSGSGYSPGFMVCVANLDANNAKHLALPSATTWLWPGQTAQVWLDSGSIIVRSAQMRYVAPALNVYANVNSGSDGNDCLSAANPCATIQNSINLIRAYADTQNTVPQINLADGTYTEAVNTSATPTGGADQIIINGHSGSPNLVQILAPGGEVAVTVRDYGIFTLKNVELGCGAGSGAINSSQFGDIDLLNVIIGSCDGHNAIAAQDMGHVTVLGGLTISGNAGNFFYGVGSGAEIVIGGGQTITCTGTPALTQFVNITNLAGLSTEGTPLSFSGCGGVTGTAYLVTNNAVADTSGSTFPGSAGSVATGGIYN